jgi:DNA-binding response OmpR family regulator
VEQEKPDLLLLDIWMPLLSGEQVIKSLKADSIFQSLPVIMYSASTDDATIVKKQVQTITCPNLLTLITWSEK